MNYAELLKTWSSPLNQPSPENIERQKHVLLRVLSRRRLGFLAIMTPPTLALVAITGILIQHLATLGAQAGAAALAQEWAAPVLLLMAWSLYVLFVRAQREHIRRHPANTPSIVASLRALLDENLCSQRRVKWVAWLHLASLPVLAMALRQLDVADKMRPHEFFSALVFFGMVIGLAILGLRFFGARKLRPEELRLRDLLRSYEE
jgi:hypothetical protein